MYWLYREFYFIVYYGELFTMGTQNLICPLFRGYFFCCILHWEEGSTVCVCIFCHRIDITYLKYYTQLYIKPVESFPVVLKYLRVWYCLFPENTKNI